MSKKSFFDRLYTMDNVDEESSLGDLEPIAQHSTRRHKKTKFIFKKGYITDFALSSDTAVKNVRATRTRALLCTNTTSQNIKSIQLDMARKHETGQPLLPESKRKRIEEDVCQSVPDEHRVFQDCVFYFIRNDDISEQRKIRHNKAREFSATCVDVFDKDVTHVIVDNDLNFQDMLKVLPVKYIPFRAHVVKQAYPADCIRYRKMLNPDQIFYRVAGYFVQNLEMSAEVSSPNLRKISTKPVKAEAPLRSQSLIEHQTTPLSLIQPSEQTLFYIGSSKSSPSLPRKEQTVAVKDSNEELSSIIQHIIVENPLDTNRFLHDNELHSGKAPETIEDVENVSPTYDFNAAQAVKRTTSKKPQQRKTNLDTWQTHFPCMKKNNGSPERINPNERTWKVLEEMKKYYESVGDSWRSISYRKVISILKRTTQKISTYEEAIKLQGVGDRLAKKIVEIVTTDSLQRLDYAKLEPDNQLLGLFKGIYGVGLAQAQKFIAAGYKTLEDVAKHPNLSDNQKIGLEHYEDFKLRIPREEISEHGKIVRETAAKIDKDVQSEIMGSYRRNAMDCGDIDIIITKHGATIPELKNFLDVLTQDLFEQGFLMCGLAIARDDDGTKWHGASKIGDTWRRIDFLLVPPEELGAAFIYFTGDDIFNRSIRLLASKKGMRLNQKGLYRDVMRGKGREKFNDGLLVEGKSEKRIFEILGVPYRPPHDRVFA